MKKENGGLARHTMECQSGVDWGNAEIVAREKGLKQRKVVEGIESLHRQRHYGMRGLNNFDHVDRWKPILNTFFDREKTAGDDELSQKLKVLDRPEFPAHLDIIYTSCNDHDTSCGYQVERQQNDPPF